MTTDPDPMTPTEERLREVHASLDVAEDSNIQLLGELDAMRAELEAARVELDKLREQVALYKRALVVASTPEHQPSRPKPEMERPPRDRPRFAGEDHDDYALRGH